MKFFKTLISLLLLINRFQAQLATGYYSLQPKPEPFNSTISSSSDPPKSLQTEISEKEEKDYIIYEITTPSMTKLYNIDDFKIDLDEKSIVIRGKVGFIKYLYIKYVVFLLKKDWEQTEPIFIP